MPESARCTEALSRMPYEWDPIPGDKVFDTKEWKERMQKVPHRLAHPRRPSPSQGTPQVIFCLEVFLMENIQFGPIFGIMKDYILLVFF